MLRPLRSLRQGVEEREPLGEMRDRFRIGRPLQGGFRGFVPVQYRPLYLPCLFEMHREFGGNALRLVSVGALFPVPNMVVQVDALPWGNACGDHLGIQRMTKPIARRYRAIRPG